MLKQLIYRELPIIGLHLIPFIYLAIVFNDLPSMVPTHFNLEGVADDYSSKFDLIWILLLLVGLSYILFLIIPFIDPKKSAQQNPKLYFKIRLGMSLLVTGLAILLVYLAYGNPMRGILALAFFLTILCIFLGNYLQAVKTNFFIGIRTPWTLSSERVWKKTHLVTGRMMFYGGVLSLIATFFMPPNYAPFPAVVILIGSAVFGLIYSFILYRRDANFSEGH